MNFVKKGICYNKEKVMNLNRKYLSFLVSELLFLKDDTIMHLIPKTECQYNKIFAKLEDICNDLNLNIRIIRRKLDLLRECDSLYVNEKVEKEFKIEIEENKIKKNKRIFTYPFEKIPQSRKKQCQDLYRSLISKYSPKLYEFPLENFENIRQAFYAYDLVSLKNMDSYKSHLELKLSTKELENLRFRLEIEISDLYRSFPLNKISLLEDSDAIIYNLKRLENIYNDYVELYGSLEEALNISIAKSLS